MNTVTNPTAIRALQLKTQIRAVELESRGLRHSGGNITPRLKKFYSMPMRASHAAVVARLKEELETLEVVDE